MKLLDIRKLIAISAVFAASCLGLIAGDMQADGMMMKDGKKMTLKNGEMITMDGKMMPAAGREK